jgi:hypothetical protein
MHTRRGALGGLATAGVAALAGCSLFDDALEQEADPAAVAEGAADSAGFEHEALTDQVAEQTVEVGDQSRDLRLTNWTNEYRRAAPGIDFDAARFLLLTTPTVTVAGQSANPLRGLDREQLLQELVDRLDITPVRNVEQVGERSVPVLEGSVTVGAFAAETEQGIQLRLHLADRTHEDDLLVLFGLHPDLLDLTEEIDTLVEGVLHPAERP